jgi:hypothetical protein
MEPFGRLDPLGFNNVKQARKNKGMKKSAISLFIIIMLFSSKG